MKVVEIREAFGLDNLQVAERPDPVVGVGQVVLKLSAASLNYRDLLMVKGLYNPRQPLPLIPCSDGVGEIVEVGDGVAADLVGVRVGTLFTPLWESGRPTKQNPRATLGGPLDGTLSELMVLSERAVIPVPEHLSDEEAATLTCAGLTAWSALVTHGGVRAGDTVLVLGTGGVSIFALQFARLLGADVIITSSSDEKLDRAEELGALAGINYRRWRGWGSQAKKLTADQGVDLVIEVGGAETLEQSVQAVRFGGQIILIGNLTGGKVDFNFIPIFMRHLKIQGILVGHREGAEAMMRAVAQHRMHPVVDQVFDIDDARQAFEALGSGSHFGKICLRF